MVAPVSEGMVCRIAGRVENAAENRTGHKRRAALRFGQTGTRDSGSCVHGVRLFRK